jgi:hypothetical protein
MHAVRYCEPDLLPGFERRAALAKVGVRGDGGDAGDGADTGGGRVELTGRVGKFAVVATEVILCIHQR